MVQITIKNIESEIHILDNSLDTKLNFPMSSMSSTSTGILSSSSSTSPTTTTILNTSAALDSWELMKAQKEQALDEAKRVHEDLEFQLMELEAKYETELEDIQSRLISERDHLLQAFKMRQVSLNEYDVQQSQMLAQVKVFALYYLLNVDKTKTKFQF